MLTPFRSGPGVNLRPTLGSFCRRKPASLTFSP